MSDIDIKDRLLDLAECERPFIQGFMREAADEIERERRVRTSLTDLLKLRGEEIERLRAENKQLKVVLREIGSNSEPLWRCQHIARAALGEGE